MSDRVANKRKTAANTEWKSANWRSERCAVTRVISGYPKADGCGPKLKGAPEAGYVNRLLTDRE
jgi:hypothetical protein